MKTQKEMVEIADQTLRFIARHAYQSVIEHNNAHRDIFVTIDENARTGDWSFKRRSPSDICLPRLESFVLNNPWYEDVRKAASTLLIDDAIRDGLLLASAEVLRAEFSFSRAEQLFYLSNNETLSEGEDKDEYDRVCIVDAVEFDDNATISDAQEAGRESARLYIAENELSYPVWKDIINEKSSQLFPYKDENRTQPEWERFVKDSIQLVRRWGKPQEIRESVETIAKQWHREQIAEQLLILPEL